MLLIEEDPRIEPDTLWKELIVSATVRKKGNGPLDQRAATKDFTIDFGF